MTIPPDKPSVCNKCHAHARPPDTCRLRGAQVARTAGTAAWPHASKVGRKHRLRRVLPDPRTCSSTSDLTCARVNMLNSVRMWVNSVLFTRVHDHEKFTPMQRRTGQAACELQQDRWGTIAGPGGGGAHLRRRIDSCRCRRACQAAPSSNQHLHRCNSGRLARPRWRPPSNGDAAPRLRAAIAHTAAREPRLDAPGRTQEPHLSVFSSGLYI